MSLPLNYEKVKRHQMRATAMVVASGSARSRTAPGVFELKPYVWRSPENPVRLRQQLELKLALAKVD